MTLPTAKTYDFTKINQALVSSGSALTDNRSGLLLIKNALKGFSNVPATVAGSSNSSAAGMDSVDRWSAAGDLVYASGAHSWIVLSFPGIGGYLCIDLNNTASNGNIASLIWSASNAFTGGSTTARPTAVGESVLMSVGTFTAMSGAANQKFHIIPSTDGQVINVIAGSAGAVVYHWIFAKAKDPISQWTNPGVAYVGTTGGGPVTVALAHDAANTKGNFGSPQVTCSFYWTSESFGSVTNRDIPRQQTYADEDSGEFPMCPIGLFCSTSGHRGRKGTLFDTYWGLTINATPATYPVLSSEEVANTREWAQFGHVVIKWDGTPLVQGSVVSLT